MTDDNFSFEYGAILKNTQRPSRYVGGEYGSYNKDFDKAQGRVLLVFPDKYEIGISNFGHKILYDIINKNEKLMADRLYAPDIDFINLLKKEDKELYALESKRKPKEFDILGFGLQYEMCYTTILKLLELSSVPIFSKDRSDFHPLIVAGGPCCSNPAPMKPFIDIFIIGDGEDALIELSEKYIELKEKNLNRFEIIKELTSIQGLYSPLVDNETTKRIAQLTYENHPTMSPVPYFTSIQDRAVVELRRGCGRLCRFCQASHINLPIRERSKEDIIQLTKEYVKNSGYDEYSLLSLSSNDHKNIEFILKELNCHFRGTGISVSLPSQRADRFSMELAKLAHGEKKATVTIAPEAGSQRLRDVINKNLNEEQIINATVACVKNGWDKIKYYFVIGLPFETFEDLDGIIDLIQKVNYRCKQEGQNKPKITCSISVFVPKPFTPFQFARQNTIEEIKEKIIYLKNQGSKVKNAKLNFHNPKMSQLESFLSRGDEKTAEFIYELYKQGAYLESWDENLDLELYQKIADKLNINIEALATREFSFEEKLPWDKINYGINKEWLFEEYKKAQNATSTIPCEIKCNNCGVCSNLKTKKVIDK